MFALCPVCNTVYVCTVCAVSQFKENIGQVLFDAQLECRLPEVRLSRMTDEHYSTFVHTCVCK